MQDFEGNKNDTHKNEKRNYLILLLCNRKFRNRQMRKMIYILLNNILVLEIDGSL